MRFIISLSIVLIAFDATKIRCIKLALDKQIRSLSCVKAHCHGCRPHGTLRSRQLCFVVPRLSLQVAAVEIVFTCICIIVAEEMCLHNNIDISPLIHCNVKFFMN